MTRFFHTVHAAGTTHLAGAVLAACALLAACSGTLLPKPAAPPARFTLETETPTIALGMPRADAPVLTVNLPRAAPGYDSRHMVYVRRPQELEHFAFHEWVEPPARMLAPQLVRALQAAGVFRAVLQAPTSAAGGWRLETELLRLQQDFSQRPSRVRLSLRAALLDGVTREAFAWRAFDIAVDAAADDPVSGAQAAAQAAQQLSAAVATFCADQVARRAQGPQR